MGTPSITYIHAKDCNGQCLRHCEGTAIYGHYDSYPHGHGAELARLLIDSEASGLDGLHDKVVALSIKGGTVDPKCGKQDNVSGGYNYSVTCENGKLKLKIDISYWNTVASPFRTVNLFTGSPQDLLLHGCPSGSELL